MKDCPKEDSYGPMFLKTCDDVAKYWPTISQPLTTKLKELHLSIDGSCEYKPLLQTKRRQKKIFATFGKKRNNFDNFSN
jgi:hypothetical protein